MSVIHRFVKKRRYGCFALFFLIAILLSSCDVYASRDSKGSIEALLATKDSAMVTGEIPDAALDTDTQKAVSLYPLRTGSTWVYEYLGFDSNREVVWQVVMNVVDVIVREDYYIAQIEQSALLLEGDPGVNFAYSPNEGTFYYLIDGENLYRIDSLDELDLQDAWLELVLPLPEPSEGWYPEPGRRSELSAGQMGYRIASAPYQEGSLAEESYVCHNISTMMVAGSERQTFCEGVGYFYAELINFDENTGYRIELKGFSLQ
jgi:hypothetical protein